MTPQDRTITLRLDGAILARLEANKDQFGTPVAEQIRRAVTAWLDAGGILAAATAAQEQKKPVLGLKLRPRRPSATEALGLKVRKKEG
jgi:hypothetical protein